METKTTKQKSYARELRSNMTEQEHKIWWHIRKKQIQGIQFYRQKTLGPYIVDFYAPSIRLVIEIDGSQHYECKHMQKDKSRDNYLSKANIQVLRFNNYEVNHCLDSVLEKLYEVVSCLKSD